MGPRGTRGGVAALFITTALALDGCGVAGSLLGGGKDGKDPVVSASAVPSASPTAAPLPEAGQCHTNHFDQQMAKSNDKVVDCAVTHVAETVYVGQFTGAAASGMAPLYAETATGAAAAIQNAAYLDCSTHADRYLGHSWIHIRLELRITVPTDTEWSAGDRWYRCDLYEVDWGINRDIDRVGSLKTTWFAAVCADTNKDDSPIVACSTKHPSEFVGGFLMPAGKKEPKTDKELSPYHDKCWKLIGTYIGTTTSQASHLTGDTLMWQFDAAAWPSGRRAAFCFTWTGAKSSSYVTGSAKGRKGKGL